MSTTKLALLGGAPIGEFPAPIHPHFTDNAIRRVEKLLRSGSTVGLNKNHPEIAEAEKTIAEWQGVPYCLGTSSGHAALQSCLIGLEVSSGDEVITTPYTWGASVSCILHNNAIPVFADVDPETGLIDPESVETVITSKTRAILAVHLYGQPANMTALRRIADRRGLVIIEDGSQAHGAIHAGRKVGTFGDAAGFSCMGGKLLASTEAGYMVTPHEEVYWKGAMGGQHMGRSPEEGFWDTLRPYVDSLVYTYRLNPITAVLLTEQITKLDAENDARRKNAATFRAAMQGVTAVSFPTYPEGDQPVFHMLTMNFDPGAAGVDRATYLAGLRAEGIRISAYVPEAIPRWNRLKAQNYDGPKTMWTDNLVRHGIDYATTDVPNCDRKVARSLEISWNYVDPDPELMTRMASAFHKVESNLDALRTWSNTNKE